MALCRFSSDDFRCDLYIYDAGRYIQVMLAESHINYDRSLMPELPPLPPEDDIEGRKEWGQLALKRYNLRHHLMDEAVAVPIGGPLDGKSFLFESTDEVVQFLQEEVIPCGKYRIPEWVIDSLKSWEFVPDDSEY